MATSPRLPPPPDLDSPESVIPDVPMSRRNQIFSSVGGALAGSTGLDFEKSPLFSAIQKSHQGEVNAARRHYRNAVTYADMLHRGDIDPSTGEPTGIDESGNPMTPDVRAQHKDMLEGAWGDFAKIAGKDKETKQSLGVRKQVLDHLITKGAEATHGALSAIGTLVPGAGGGTPDSGGAPQRGGLPPLPQVGDVSPQTDESGNPQASAAAATPGLPPPPPVGASYDRSAELSAGMTTTGVKGQIAATQGAQADIAKRHIEAKAAGFKPGTPEYQRYMATGTMAPIRAPMTLALDVLGSQSQDVPRLDGKPVDPNEHYRHMYEPTTGEEFLVPKTGTVGQMTTKAIQSPGGPPIGLTVGGEPRMPGDDAWTKGNQKELDALKASWNKGDEAKNYRVKLSATTRAVMQAKMRPMNMINKETGELETPTAYDVAQNPGKYAATTPAMATMTTNAIFQDIDTAKQILNEAIGKMGDESFNAESRLQIAAALRSEDPRSLIDSFLSSTAATTLSEDQVKYVTALANMRESSLAMRSVQGIGGAGSDMVRDAILKLLPSASTPTKEYAQRQMSLFDKEVTALKTRMPGLGKLATRTGAPSVPGDTVTIVSHGQRGKIPRAQLDAARKIDPQLQVVQ